LEVELGEVQVMDQGVAADRRHKAEEADSADQEKEAAGQHPHPTALPHVFGGAEAHSSF
jgi:hypothetical protein